VKTLQTLILLLLVAALTACAAVTTARQTGTAAEQAAPVPEAAAAAQTTSPIDIVKSPNDDRDYRYLTLANGLRVLLVSDPQTDKAAASLVVFRGSYHEPDAYPGLAHFLEHMLFIGTEKYPEVDAYQEFISRHGGSSNAYTAGDHTNYFFDVQPDQFRPAMDRFAQFFISPLLAEDYVEREKNAVHSEYQLQLKADNWRGAAVMGEAMNPAHPESRFSIGSLKTLGDGVGQALKDFFDTQYSADQMVLVAFSDEPLDELTGWVAPLFAAIENRRLGPAPVDEPLFLDNLIPAVVSYQTIKEGYQVVYNFPVPAIEQYYREKPAEYVANLLGHEGQGSLFQYLQQQGWVESLAAGTGSFDARNSLLTVDMALTNQGYEHLDDVSRALFDYIDLLRSQRPEAWRYQEQARVAELGFRFQERSAASRFVYQVAPRFMHYPPEDVLAAPYLMTRFDAGLIESYLNALNLDNVVVEVAGPDVPAEHRERWFDVPYRIELRRPVRSATAAGTLALPPPNPYLPEDLEVLADDPEPPRLAVARPGLTLYADRDTEFDTPRANLYLSLGIPDGITSPQDLAMATLYLRVVRDALSETVYPAYLAGLGYGLDVNGYGLEVAVSGYSDKQLTLLTTVLDALTGTVIDPARFAVLRDELLRDWRNYREERPYSQAYGALGYLLLSNRWPPEMLIEAVRERTAEELQRWREERLGRFHVLGLNHGNVPIAGAWALAAALQEHLQLGAFPRRKPLVTEVAAAYRYPMDIDHDDAAMVIYLQNEQSGPAQRARSGLAASMLRQAYFTSLRTEQQLGYVVAVANQTLRERGGLAFIVQSPVASAADLERATRDFLTSQLEALETMPETAFDSFKQGLIGRLTESDKNLNERGQRLWTDLDLGITSFDSRQQIAAEVAALGKSDVLEFLAAAAAAYPQRRLLVYSNGRFDEAPQEGPVLGNIRDFKQTR